MSMDTKHHSYLQQYVRLTGLGSKPFDTFIENIHHIQMKFERQFADGALERWSASDFMETFSSIEIANRYFTPAYLTPTLKDNSITPSPMVDPQGSILTVVKQGKMLYLPDNLVLYFKKSMNKEGGGYM